MPPKKGSKVFRLDWHQDGVRRRISAQTSDPAVAEERRAALERQLSAGGVALKVVPAPTRVVPAPAAPPEQPNAAISALLESDAPGPTIREYLDATWLPLRKKKLPTGWIDDDSRLRHHFLPTFGAVRRRAMASDEGTAALLQWAYDLRAHASQRDGTPISARTVRNVISSVRVMFADAAELRAIPRDPCLGIRWKKHVPRKRDKDPRWRRGLKAWSLEEVVLLTTDERIPEDHRILNALRFLSGLRPSSEATLRFSDIDTARAPIWAMSVTTAFDSRSRTEKDQTKTGVEYVVPVHPVLRRALESWLAEGWERFTGRAPRPDDLVIPNHRLTPRTAQTKREAFYADLDRVGIPRQRPYETRATFRNLCLAGGAARDAVNRITHPKPSQASDY
jgi:integrase